MLDSVRQTGLQSEHRLQFGCCRSEGVDVVDALGVGTSHHSNNRRRVPLQTDRTDRTPFSANRLHRRRVSSGDLSTDRDRVARPVRCDCPDAARHPSSSRFRDQRKVGSWSGLERDPQPYGLPPGQQEGQVPAQQVPIAIVGRHEHRHRLWLTGRSRLIRPGVQSVANHSVTAPIPLHQSWAHGRPSDDTASTGTTE